jgi:hypothetical protein
MVARSGCDRCVCVLVLSEEFEGYLPGRFGGGRWAVYLGHAGCRSTTGLRLHRRNATVTAV